MNRRLSSRVVRTGVTVALLAGSLAGCSDSGEETQTVQTEHGEICARRSGATGEFDIRVDWNECERDTNHVSYFPYYINHGGGRTAPPVGSRIVPGSGTTVRPASGAVARPPSTGGFGTHTTTAGG